MKIVSMTRIEESILETSPDSKFVELRMICGRKERFPISLVWDALKKLFVELEPGDDPGLGRRRHEAWAAMAAGQEYADGKY